MKAQLARPMVCFVKATKLMYILSTVRGTHAANHCFSTRECAERCAARMQHFGYRTRVMEGNATFQHKM